jgi:hypothetical protein
MAYSHGGTLPANESTDFASGYLGAGATGRLLLSAGYQKLNYSNALMRAPTRTMDQLVHAFWWRVSFRFRRIRQDHRLEIRSEHPALSAISITRSYGYYRAVDRRTWA